MKVHTIRQRSAEWHALRRGIPTASDFDRIITEKGARSAQARKYMYQLAYERILDKNFQRPNLAAIPHIQHGIINEDKAVRAFEQHARLKTEPIGFITNDEGSVGCSPDRLIVGRDEALEIKCPEGHTHVGYLIDGRMSAYEAQLQGEMLIGGFTCIHFFSWHEELPPYYAIVRPNFPFIKALALYLVEFDAELEKGVAHVKAMGHWPRNAPSVFPEDEPDDAA